MDDQVRLTLMRKTLEPHATHLHPSVIYPVLCGSEGKLPLLFPSFLPSLQNRQVRISGCQSKFGNILEHPGSSVG